MPEEQTASATAVQAPSPTEKASETKPQPPATTPAPSAPNADDNSQAKPEFDYRAAWIATQNTVRKLHDNNAAKDKQLSAVNEELRAIRETMNSVAARSLSPDEMKALDERQKVAAERAAALQAAQSLEQSVQATISLADRIMASAGLSEEDRRSVYLAAKSASGIQEWSEAVHTLATQKIQQAFEQRMSKIEGELRGKAAAEAKAEAEALLAQQVKELDIDKVDTSTGSAAPSRKTVAEMTDEEFAVYSEQKQRERDERRIQRLRR